MVILVEGRTLAIFHLDRLQQWHRVSGGCALDVPRPCAVRLVLLGDNYGRLDSVWGCAESVAVSGLQGGNLCSRFDPEV